MTLDEVITSAQECLDCGQIHQPRKIGDLGVTWADPADDHAYRTPVSPDVVAWLESLRAPDS